MSLQQTKEKDGTINIRVCGYLPRDAYVPESGKVVLFSVCYGKSKFMDCKVWVNEKTGRLAACLERHDQVAVDGVLESYNDKEGKQRWQVAVDHIEVQQEAPEAEDDGSNRDEPPGPVGAQFHDEEDDGTLPF